MKYYFGVLQKYATFSGRAQRKEYWMFILFNFIIGIVIGIIGRILAPESNVNTLSALYSLAVFIPYIAVTVRRFHDTNHSGWWILFNLIPFVGWIVTTVFMVTDSQLGENQYGPNPKEVNPNY